MELKIRSINVRGLNNNHKRNAILTNLKLEKSDIILVQETHCVKHLEQAWTREWQNEAKFSNGTSQSCGVAILFGRHFTISNYYSDNEGRLQILDIYKDNEQLCIVNIYAPNKDGERVTFFTELLQVLATRRYDKIIIGGDFNTTLGHKDKIGGKRKNYKSSKQLNNLMDSLELLDVWRKLHANEIDYSWSQPNPRVMCRLDFFLVSKSICPFVESCTMRHMPLTDHKLITIDINGMQTERGPGFWTFNNSFLNDESFCNNIIEIIRQKWDESSYTNDLNVRYDFLKFEIKQQSLRYGKKKARERRKTERALEEKIRLLDRRLISKEITDNELNELEETKSRLNEIELYKAKGKFIRSRIKFIEANEKSTAFFFNQQKHNLSKKSIDKLISRSGAVITKPKEVLEEIKIFYKTLYTSKGVGNGSSFLESMPIPKLSESSKTTCEGRLTIDECFKSLTDMHTNKSPGSDGLTVEFFRRFWADIGPILVEVLNYSLEKGSLPTSLRQAVITVLHKSGKDACFVKNYRPISLLNTDYKIMTKSLANRMNSTLAEIISRDQTGFIKNRYIGENIRLISDIVDITESQNLPGLLLLLDFEKAYDTVEWEFLNEVIKKFNFGPSILKWIQLCYTNICSTVVNKGFSCGWFQVCRGLRQGCGLSCTLFDLVAEILAIIIRESNDIKGLKILGKEYKLSQFADDATCILADEHSALSVINVAERFEQQSGLRLNLDKTQLIWLGPWKNKTSGIGSLSSHVGNFKLLGIQLGYNRQETINVNFTEKRQKMQIRQNMWSGRDLSLIGKIQIAKSLGLSNMIYSLSMQACPQHIITDTQNTIRSFVWNDKPPKVRHVVLRQDIKQCGLRSPDVNLMNKSIKLAWLSRLNTGAKWITLVNDAYFKPYGGIQYLLTCNYNTKYLKDIPDFYKEVVTSLAELTIRTSSQLQRVWNNENVLVDRQMVYKDSWRKAGVEYFSDLKTAHKTWLTLSEFESKFGFTPNVSEYKKLVRAIDSLNYVQYCVTDFLKPGQVLCKSGNILNTLTAKCKDYYNEFIEHDKHMPTSLNYWLQYSANEQYLLNSLRLTQNCTTDTKLIAFQFKIVHNIVACKTNLFKWDIAATENCDYCQGHDDLVHSLVQCPASAILISEIYALLHIPCVRFNTYGFLFGCNNQAIDLINLIIKYLLWKSRFYYTNLSVNYVKNEIVFRIKADQSILSERRYNTKWQEFLHLCED